MCYFFDLIDSIVSVDSLEWNYRIKCRTVLSTNCLIVNCSSWGSIFLAKDFYDSDNRFDVFMLLYELKKEAP
jgi:hypothetical protein